VINFMYNVDPVNGDDSTGTGDSAQGCAFKTIKRALQVIGTAVTANTITVIGPSTVSAGETFPIIVPTNVTITTSTGAVTINVPAGRNGFTLDATKTTITGGTGAALTIEGTPSGAVSMANSGTNGIVVGTGSDSTTVISNLTVRDFLRDGILVQNAGVLSIGAGVSSGLNGSTTAAASGLHVTGTGTATISVQPGSTPTHFNSNTNHGINIDGLGSITVTGVVTNAIAGTGTVTANANHFAGLWISQTGANPPLNTITGLVSYASTNGAAGIHLIAGSNVKVRSSVSLANANNGVLVTGPMGAAVDISKIDLGTATDGNNTFQEPLGMNPNGGVGICLNVPRNSGQLAAQGNTFGSTNCSTTAGVLTANRFCGGGADVGIVTAMGNSIDTTMCTHP
jgi:hypothetical protein